MQRPGFWDDQEQATEASSAHARAQKRLERFRTLESDAADLEDTMTSALEADGPVLLDVRVAREENCYPMIPPGNAARDMVEAPRTVL